MTAPSQGTEWGRDKGEVRKGEEGRKKKDMAGERKIEKEEEEEGERSTVGGSIYDEGRGGK